MTSSGRRGWQLDRFWCQPKDKVIHPLKLSFAITIVSTIGQKVVRHVVLIIISLFTLVILMSLLQHWLLLLSHTQLALKGHGLAFRFANALLCKLNFSQTLRNLRFAVSVVSVAVRILV